MRVVKIGMCVKPVYLGFELVMISLLNVPGRTGGGYALIIIGRCYLLCLSGSLLPCTVQVYPVTSLVRRDQLSSFIARWQPYVVGSDRIPNIAAPLPISVCEVL